MADYTADMRSKTGMKTLFGKKNIKKDNTEGKVSPSTSLLTISDITGSTSYFLDRLPVSVSVFVGLDWQEIHLHVIVELHSLPWPSLGLTFDLLIGKQCQKEAGVVGCV